MHAAELELYGDAAQMTQLTVKPETERDPRFPMPQEAFSGDAPLSAQEAVPAGGEFAQHVLDTMQPTADAETHAAGTQLMLITNRLQGKSSDTIIQYTYKLFLVT